MSRQFWNESDERLEQMLRLFKGSAEQIDEPKVKRGLEEQATNIQEEIDRRFRARSVSPVRFGIKVKVTELLPICAQCATPPVGMVGIALGEEYPGATAVQFLRAELYPLPNGEDEDDRDPLVVLFMPNYSIEAI